MLTPCPARFGPPGPLAEQLRPVGVALLFHQECEMNERFVMIRLEIQRLAVELRGSRLVAARVVHQSHQIERLRRRTMLPQMRFAAGRRFDEVPLVGELGGLGRAPVSAAVFTATAGAIGGSSARRAGARCSGPRWGDGCGAARRVTGRFTGSATRAGRALDFRNANASGTLADSNSWLSNRPVSDGATNSTPFGASRRSSTPIARSCVGRSK